MDNQKDFIKKLEKWKLKYPELDFLSLKLIEYQQRLINKHITLMEFEVLIDTLTNFKNVEQKLKNAIERDKIQEALDFLKDLGKLAALVIVL